MFALYEWFVLPVTITCWPSRSFFLFSFCFSFSYACLQKTIHPSLSMRKAFFLCTPTFLYEKKLFSLYTHTLKNSFSLYQHGLYKISIPFQRFLFPFSIYTHCLYKKFLYIHSLLIYKNFFSHIVYIQNLFSHIVYIQKKSFLFFIYRYDILFTMSLSFSILGVITTFVRFILGWRS